MPPTPGTEPLGRQLLATLEDVNELYQKVTTPQEVEQLNKKRKLLLEQIGALVDMNLDQGSHEYLATTQGLKNASAKIRESMNQIEKVAQAITALGQALDLVATLAGGGSREWS